MQHWQGRLERVKRFKASTLGGRITRLLPKPQGPLDGTFFLVRDNYGFRVFELKAVQGKRCLRRRKSNGKFIRATSVKQRRGGKQRRSPLRYKNMLYSVESTSWWSAVERTESPEASGQADSMRAVAET